MKIFKDRSRSCILKLYNCRIQEWESMHVLMKFNVTSKSLAVGQLVNKDNGRRAAVPTIVIEILINCQRIVSESMGGPPLLGDTHQCSWDFRFHLLPGLNPSNRIKGCCNWAVVTIQHCHIRCSREVNQSKNSNRLCGSYQRQLQLQFPHYLDHRFTDLVVSSSDIASVIGGRVFVTNRLIRLH